MSSAGPEHDRPSPRPRPQPYFSSANGTVYYTPNRPAERRRRADPGHFPAPLIQPRQRRPHAIHIVSYPPGFVPHELRPASSKASRDKREDKKRKKEEARERKREEKERRRVEEERCEKQEKRRSLRSLPPGSETVGRVIDKIFAAFSITPKPSPVVSAVPTPRTQSRPSSFISFARRLSRLEPTSPEPIVVEDPVAEPLSMAGAAVPRPRAATTVVSANRNSMMSIRSAKIMMSSSVSEVQKPVASGSGVTCSILLAEPNVFLTGFEHDHHTRRGAQTTSALLRGKLQLNVSKNVKIKSITLKLVGKARTEWPEGIPPAKADLYEEQTLRAQSLVFFHAMHQGMWDTEYGSQCTYTHKNAGLMNALQPTGSNGSLHILGKGRASTLTAKEYKRLSLQSVNSRSFGKGDSPHINQVQAKGYKVFRPGTYEYAFELPIDHNQLETAKLPYGSVRWDLETTVERAGAFKPNLHGAKEVSIVRLPDQMSLETVEPISISRHWEDQLHYDIIISGKSFPIGGRIPIAFKLTPLAKVQVHKLKVHVTESIEYWTNDRHVTRKDAGRKLLLLEKSAGKPLDKQYSASDVRVLCGGELEPDQREEARRTAARRRMRDASWNRAPEPLPEPSNNLLGDLDLGLESFWGSTEIEMNVQLPTCEMMARDKALRLHPDCSWKNANVFHWIKIVMRISRADPDDPTGKRRRHFEISIDSPFTVLNCRATQANTALPQYNSSDGPVPAQQRQQMSCGCPDATPLDPAAAALSRPLTMIEEDTFTLNGGRRLRLDCPTPPSFPTLPQAAHLQAAASRANGQVGRQNSPETSSSLATRAPYQQEEQTQDRPIHLLRHPSHNPPAFDADEPPPPLAMLPLQTPPPHYDVIVGTPSVDGLADYFARLAAYEGEGEGVPGVGLDVPGVGVPGVGVPGVGVGVGVGQGGVLRGVGVQGLGLGGVQGEGEGLGEVVPADSDSDTNTIGPDDATDTGSGVETEPTTGSATASGLLQSAALGGGGNGRDREVDPFSLLPLVPTAGTTGEGQPALQENDTMVADDVDSSASDSAEEEEDGRARLHRRGRVNVANPRTPGGRLVPSRSLEIERPVVRLDMAGVLRRGRQG